MERKNKTNSEYMSLKEIVRLLRKMGIFGSTNEPKVVQDLRRSGFKFEISKDDGHLLKPEDRNLI